MRINPISMTYSRQNLKTHNQNNKQNQNVSFGRFADERARRMTYEYLRVDEGDSWIKEAFDYLNETPFVTFKSTLNKNGKPFVYAVAEQKAINKHENKDMFNKMLYQTYYSLNPATLRTNKDAREVGATKDSGFLTVVSDFSDAHNLYENFCDCEDGCYGKGGDLSSDNSKPVESNMEKAWDLYGTRN